MVPIKKKNPTYAVPSKESPKEHIPIIPVSNLDNPVDFNFSHHSSVH
jgi:hypothetical protein